MGYQMVLKLHARTLSGHHPPPQARMLPRLLLSCQHVFGLTSHGQGIARRIDFVAFTSTEVL